MSRVVNHARKVLFQLRWAFMSQEKRYAYLWQRTKEGMQ